jgi:hypothetical protein
MLTEDNMSELKNKIDSLIIEYGFNSYAIFFDGEKEQSAQLYDIGECENKKPIAAHAGLVWGSLSNARVLLEGLVDAIGPQKSLLDLRHNQLSKCMADLDIVQKVLYCMEKEEENGVYDETKVIEEDIHGEDTSQ